MMESDGENAKPLRVLLALAELRQEARDMMAAAEGPTGESPEAPQQGFSCTVSQGSLSGNVGSLRF